MINFCYGFCIIFHLFFKFLFLINSKSIIVIFVIVNKQCINNLECLKKYQHDFDKIKILGFQNEITILSSSLRRITFRTYIIQSTTTTAAFNDVSARIKGLTTRIPAEDDVLFDSRNSGIRFLIGIHLRSVWSDRPLRSDRYVVGNPRNRLLCRGRVSMPPTVGYVYHGSGSSRGW